MVDEEKVVRAEAANGVDSASSLSSIASSLKSKGYLFAARYYSSDASQWKVMSAAESSAIANAGLKRIVVFENSSNSDNYFSAAQGQNDASKAISLAKARGQATGSAIYFAVDYDASEKVINNQIKKYFTEVQSMLSKAGYSVGVYGSGRTCRLIKAAGLAGYTWLAMSSGWSEYSTYSDWNIKQLKTTTISGVSVDTDYAKNISRMGGW